MAECGVAAQNSIEGCIALRLLIEKLIKNGKLVLFWGEQRNQTGNDRDNKPQNRRGHQPRDYNPRDLPKWDEKDLENDPLEHIERREDRRSKSLQCREPRQHEVIAKIRHKVPKILGVWM